MISTRLTKTFVGAVCAAAIVCSDCVGAYAASNSPVVSSNRLAMKIATNRPAAKFRGITIVSPPALWLTYAAVFIALGAGEPTHSALPRPERQAGLLNLADAIGYSEVPTHVRVLSDAAELRTAARGADIDMALWTRSGADVDRATTDELGRLGVQAMSGPMDATTARLMNTWLRRTTKDAFSDPGPEVLGRSTGVVLATLKHRLALPSPFRAPSIVAPRVVPTVEGGIPSLPGNSIAYFTDATSVTGIRLDADSGRFFLFTGSSDDLQQMLGTLTVAKWSELKSRFQPTFGRIVDAFRSESQYNATPLVDLRFRHLWGNSLDTALQLGSIDIDRTQLNLTATTEYVAEECCSDYLVDPQTESQFQFSSLAPIVFIDEAPSGLILFLGYRL